jgi:hypothetical protein
MKSHNVLYWAAIVACLIGIGSGLTLLMSHETIAGAQAPAPTVAPHIANIRFDGKPVVIMFAHPKCQCTEASLTELQNIYMAVGSKAEYYVFFVRPSDEPVGWEHTRIWNEAASLPYVTVQVDPDCALAKQLGAETSGHTICYDALGHLTYTGGITLGRAHTGRNPGEDSVIEALLGQPRTITHSAVFGCALYAAPTAPQADKS